PSGPSGQLRRDGLGAGRRLPARDRRAPGFADSARGVAAAGVKKPDSAACTIGLLLVPKRGLEPRREYSHYALNVARLPIPPLRRERDGVYGCQPAADNWPRAGIGDVLQLFDSIAGSLPRL